MATEKREKCPICGQMAYLEEHHITPTTIIKPIKNTLEITKKAKTEKKKKLTKAETLAEIDRLETLMKISAEELDFEVAIKFREEIKKLKENIK